ncbi:MAG: Aspartyl/glutamyl-tRNA amidotransferase subunit C [Candidatus Jorgensenbacteria bacterium GW2011_GWC1_48_8]|nr:MAG: Aspartyl/glutamyl-tRNA amidotransferase subunit C [Candidatus Jorgensenbacteria bacterium GW2011_GWC1_48_8]
MELKKSEEEKLLKDLEKILGHFEELKELDTEGVLPMSGGTFSRNILRADDLEETKLAGEKSVSQFPERDKGFLKIPPVFE